MTSSRPSLDMSSQKSPKCHRRHHYWKQHIQRTRHSAHTIKPHISTECPLRKLQCSWYPTHQNRLFLQNFLLRELSCPQIHIWAYHARNFRHCGSNWNLESFVDPSKLQNQIFWVGQHPQGSSEFWTLSGSKHFWQLYSICANGHFQSLR